MLLKNFKYFDLNNDGELNVVEFGKALEKLGIIIPTRQDLQALFDCYDPDASSSISYRDFASQIFGYPISTGQTSEAES